MVAKTLSSDRYSAAIYRGPAARNSLRVVRAGLGDEDASRAPVTRPARIDDLAVVLSSSEPHRDVAIRAQLLAHTAPVARTALLIARSPTWHRFVPGIAMLRRRRSGPGADVSARVLVASFPPERTRVETCRTAADLIKRANDADLVVVGRRRRSANDAIAASWVNVAVNEMYLRRSARHRNRWEPTAG